MRRFLPVLLTLLLFTACSQLEDADLTTPGDGTRAGAPTGSFGVSGSYDGPFLNNAESPISDAADARIVTVDPGGKFYVQVAYADPEGISGVEVNLVNASPEGLAGTLDPTQSFFTLGQPTGISEPSTGCDLSGSPTTVSCIYEVRVAEDAVNITELENAATEFAYIFRTKVTDKLGNSSNAAVSGYVVVIGEGETPTPPAPGEGEQEVCSKSGEFPR